MKKQPPSIFNDVIGPVMRGPSSSHTAAAVRIGSLLRQFYNGQCKSYIVEFEPKGSLATTYSSQGSDIGLVGGLLGMDTADPGLTDALEIARVNGLEVRFNITDFEASHPNTYRIRAVNDHGREDIFRYISTGGGMIELNEINGITVNIKGDYYETLLFFDEINTHVLEKKKKSVEGLVTDFDYCLMICGETGSLINIKSVDPLAGEVIDTFKQLINPARVVQLSPVLPVRSGINFNVPYTTVAGMLSAAETEGLQLFELAIKYESARGGITGADVIALGENIFAVMRNSIKEGLCGTDYDDRILGVQAVKLNEFQGNLIGGSQVKKVIAYITAIMEAKSAMKVIVAAPTAGSCAGIPGTLLAVADELELGDQLVLQGLLAAGLVGVLIAGQSTFAAEECGCQAECGSASGMVAAALVQISGGTVKQAFDAASIALQNIMGLVCDPVANRVEVPCLGKNVLAGMNAIAAANMVLAGYDAVIPLDETIAALDQVGRMLPSELRCTGKAGLSITPTSAAISDRLFRRGF